MSATRSRAVEQDPGARGGGTAPAGEQDPAPGQGPVSGQASGKTGTSGRASGRAAGTGQGRRRTAASRTTDSPPETDDLDGTETGGTQGADAEVSASDAASPAEDPELTTPGAVVEKAPPKKRVSRKKAVSAAGPTGQATTTADTGAGPEQAATTTAHAATSLEPGVSTDKTDTSPEPEPAPERDAAPAAPLTATEIIKAPAGRTREALARVLERPGYAPELLAVAAVQTLGPTAADWVRRTRADYPTASPDGLARLATQRFVRLGTAGGAIAVASGVFAPLAELASVAWVQAGLALHIAACYDHDPVDPDRAVDLLVLTQVHPDDDSARAALSAAVSAEAEEELALHRIAEAGWRLAAPLAAQTGGWLALRLLGRVFPGSRPLAVVAGNSAATQRLAARAITRYRPRGTR